MNHWSEDPEPATIDPLTDLVALWTAAEPEELWRALVVGVGPDTNDPWVAVHLFRRQHEHGADGALITALLLCTDRRWDRVTSRLIAGISDSAILDEDDLDELAACFLWSERFRFEYPVDWIGTEWVGIDLDGGEGVTSPRVMHLDPDTPVPTERAIRPPLRRWAAARVLRTDPSTFEPMWARAAELGSLDGAAVVSGMLDSIEVLADGVARRTIDLGLGWPRASVRLLALDLLAAVDPEVARSRAAADPDQKVRAWKPRRPRGRLGSVQGNDRRPGTKPRRHPGPGNAQATLFPE